MTKDFAYEKRILELIGMPSDLPDSILENLNYVHLVENHFFRKKSCNDYRNAAIDFARKNHLNFSSSFNTYKDFMKRFVKVNCPNCSDLLEGGFGGGSGHEYHIDYNCKFCKIKVSLSGNPMGGFEMRYED